MEEKVEVAAEDRLSAALERMEHALGRLEAQYEALSARIDHIAATIEETPATADKQSSRKTISPAVSAFLAKNGLESDAVESATLVKALASLSVEQRIAVKAQLAQAGMIE